ncbi:MAG: PilT/PilU family type 4a pilus ATPase [Verrucomicrobiota bacterium]|nr:PilT/PilU family type 4a pilus ATPase [Verrucomicrobiota bacterium]
MQIKKLLILMTELKASDLFISANKIPRFRINGQITLIETLDIVQEKDIIDFAKKEFSPRQFQSLEKDRELDLGLSLEGKKRFRINCYYQKHAISMVVRRIPSGDLYFEKLNLPNTLKEFASASRGLILITGTASSGKSTTMSAVVNHINQNSTKHIISIEDPIEYIHNDNKSLISQREIGSDTLSFTNALKHILRESPDVIVIGEMRDLDTMRTAISASLTGHLVISTLHTADVVQTVERIVNFFPEHLRKQIAVDLAVALTGIVSQRLLQRKDKKTLIPALEILKVTPLASKLIAQQNFADLEEVMKEGISEGMSTFNQSLTKLYIEKKISKKNGLIASTNDDEFLLSIRGMETGIETFRDKEKSIPTSKADMKSFLKAVIQNDASDLLISAGTPASLRIDGELFSLDSGPLSPDQTKHLLFSILSPNQRVHFEQEKEIDFALSINLKIKINDIKEYKRFRFRVNGFFQKGHISCAIRAIRTQIPDPIALGLPQVLLDMSKRNHGLILITGPTGSGKTTTLACLIDLINQARSCHIITIEDPIEYIHHNKKAVVEQREVRADTKTFKSALKYILRQDPDVILVGEMRDPETISAALTAAETGHLVLATLHTNSAPQTIDRIVDSFHPQQQNQVRSQLAASILLIASQRLLASKNENGRLAAFEIMLGTIAIKSLIRENKMHQARAIMETAMHDGMITMSRALENLHIKGFISNETKDLSSTQLMKKNL